MKKDRFIKLYKDNANEWRWSLVHKNGNILGDSSESYKNRSDIMEQIETNFPDMHVFEFGEDEVNDE